jgi:hypothetical protein
MLTSAAELGPHEPFQRSRKRRSERRARSAPAAAIISKPITGVSMSELTRYHQNPRGLCLPSKAIKKQKSTYRKNIIIRPTGAEQLNPEAATATRSPHFHTLWFCFLPSDLTGFLLRRFGLYLRYRQFAFFELVRKMCPYCLGIEIQEGTT